MTRHAAARDPTLRSHSCAQVLHQKSKPPSGPVGSGAQYGGCGGPLNRGQDHIVPRFERSAGKRESEAQQSSDEAAECTEYPRQIMAKASVSGSFTHMKLGVRGGARQVTVDRCRGRAWQVRGLGQMRLRCRWSWEGINLGTVNTADRHEWIESSRTGINSGFYGVTSNE